jgi:hypothetical protein
MYGMYTFHVLFHKAYHKKSGYDGFDKFVHKSRLFKLQMAYKVICVGGNVFIVQSKRSILKHTAKCSFKDCRLSHATVSRVLVKNKLDVFFEPKVHTVNK